MADSTFLVSMATEYGTMGIWFDSKDNKEKIESALAHCVQTGDPFQGIQDNGEVGFRYNAITAYSVVEITPKSKVR